MCSCTHPIQLCCPVQCFSELVFELSLHTFCSSSHVTLKHTFWLAAAIPLQWRHPASHTEPSCGFFPFLASVLSVRLHLWLSHMGGCSSPLSGYLRLHNLIKGLDWLQQSVCAYIGEGWRCDWVPGNRGTSSRESRTAARLKSPLVPPRYPACLSLFLCGCLPVCLSLSLHPSSFCRIESPFLLQRTSGYQRNDHYTPAGPCWRCWPPCIWWCGRFPRRWVESSAAWSPRGRSWPCDLERSINGDLCGRHRCVSPCQANLVH